MDWQSNEGLFDKFSNAISEHQEKWWGTQKCRRCNMAGLPAREGLLASVVVCPDCDGTGWTEWAAYATEPWSQILTNLWIGGHDYNVGVNGFQDIQDAYPRDHFDLVVSMYYRSIAYEPTSGQHVKILFPDSQLSDENRDLAVSASFSIASAVREGQNVLVRCQAGLNRSSLVAGIALVDLGFDGADVVQMIRARRSPWALCNDSYAEFLASGAAKRALEKHGAPSN